MSATFHTSLLFSVGGNEEHEHDLRLTYSVVPGSPATGPSYASGGEPGYGPEVDLLTAHVKVGDDWIALPEWMFGVLYSDEELQNALLEDEEEADLAARERADEMRRDDMRDPFA